MAELKDIVLDNDYDFRESNGDFFIGESDTQNIGFIVRSVKGNYLEFPTLGVEIDKWRSGNLSGDELRRNIRLELEKDNMNLVSFSIDNGIITIDAKRIN